MILCIGMQSIISDMRLTKDYHLQNHEPRKMQMKECARWMPLSVDARYLIHQA